MRNGYIVQTLTSVDNQEIVKIGGRVIEIYEGVIYRENFKIHPFERVIDNLFTLRQKYKHENNDVMQLLVKLIMNALYGLFVMDKKDVQVEAQLNIGLCTFKRKLLLNKINILINFVHGLSKKDSDFEESIFSRANETAFHVPRGTFQGKMFFYIKKIVHIFPDFHRKLFRVWRILS